MTNEAVRRHLTNLAFHHFVDLVPPRTHHRPARHLRLFRSQSPSSQEHIFSTASGFGPIGYFTYLFLIAGAFSPDPADIFVAYLIGLLCTGWPWFIIGTLGPLGGSRPTSSLSLCTNSDALAAMKPTRSEVAGNVPAATWITAMIAMSSSSPVRNARVPIGYVNCQRCESTILI